MNRITNTRNGNGINVVALVKGDERYIILFDDSHRSEALRQLGRWASDRKLSFNWYDAARVSQSIRERHSTER